MAIAIIIEGVLTPEKTFLTLSQSLLLSRFPL
jgi:hypothetical protein